MYIITIRIGEMKYIFVSLGFVFRVSIVSQVLLITLRYKIHSDCETFIKLIFQNPEDSSGEVESFLGNSGDWELELSVNRLIKE